MITFIDQLDDRYNIFRLIFYIFDYWPKFSKFHKLVESLQYFCMLFNAMDILAVRWNVFRVRDSVLFNKIKGIVRRREYEISVYLVGVKLIASIFLSELC